MFYKFCRALKKNQKGFTLVELMVVLIIIGILVAIAVPVYNNVTAGAEERACHANLKTIDSAKTQYQIGGGTYPGDYFQGGAIPTCPGGGTYSNTDAGDVGTPASCSTHGTP